MSVVQRIEGGYFGVILGQEITRVLMHNGVGFDESPEEGDRVKI